MNVGELKVALVNRYFADKHAGRLLLRLDDFGPACEGGSPDDVLEDIKALGISFDSVVRASEHLDAIAEYARSLIRQGDAYMDDTPRNEVSSRVAACLTVG